MVEGEDMHTRTRVETKSPEPLEREEEEVEPRDPNSLFARYDVNADGVISRAEAKAMFLEMTGETSGTPEESVKAMLDSYFEKADVNNDGTLSKEEFGRFCATISGLSSVLGAGSSKSSATFELQPAVPAPAPEPVSSLDYFRRFDVNMDAKLDIDEATTLIKTTIAGLGLTTDWVTPTFVKEQFRAVDLDGDSDTLTEDEYVAFIENIMVLVSQLGSIAPPEDDGAVGEIEGEEVDTGAEAAEEVSEKKKSSSSCTIL